MAITDLINRIGTGISQFEGFLGIGADGGQQTFNVGKIRSDINSMGGLARPPLFLATVNPPRALVGAGPQPLLCSSATLPGKQIIPVDHKRLGYGTLDRRVSGAVNPDVSLTFFVGTNGEPLTYFNSWLDNIFYTDARNGGEGSSPGGTPTFNIRFRSEYISTVQIAWFDDAQQRFLEYTLHECFPMQIGDVSLAWAENDSFASVAVNFTYRYYTLNTIETAVPGSGRGFLGLLKNGLGVVSRLNNSRFQGFGINDLLNPNLSNASRVGLALGAVNSTVKLF